MVRQRAPSSTAIEAQFELSQDTCVDISNSYSEAHQVKSHKPSHGTRTLAPAKRTFYRKTTHLQRPSTRAPSQTYCLDAHYSLFESKRRPKSAKTGTRTATVPSPTRRSKSTLPFSRSVTPQTTGPTTRPSSMTLTPKTVTPRLTKCRDLKPHLDTETPRPVFNTFKPKTSRSKSEEESFQDVFKPRSNLNTPTDRMMVSRTFASTPAASQSTANTQRQSTIPRPKSTKDLFCNCPAGQPKVKVKYATNLSTWNGHEATTKEYERVTNLWSTQGLHWINCSGGEMCSRAVEGGHTRSGEPLYIARALTPDKNKCIGTYHPSTGLCYVPWKGKEIITDDYELLCYRSKIQSPAALYNYAPTTNLIDTLKVLTLRNRRQTTC